MSFSDRKLLTPELPELTELLLLVPLGLLLPASFLDLLLAGYLNLFFESLPASLLFFKQFECLLLGFFDLLVEYLILLVFHALEYLRLPLDQLLSLLLLFLELLLLPVLL